MLKVGTIKLINELNISEGKVIYWLDPAGETSQLGVINSIPKGKLSKDTIIQCHNTYSEWECFPWELYRITIEELGTNEVYEIPKHQWKILEASGLLSNENHCYFEGTILTLDHLYSLQPREHIEERSVGIKLGTIQSKKQVEEELERCKDLTYFYYTYICKSLTLPKQLKNLKFITLP